MFGLMPWRKEREREGKGLVPRSEFPLAGLRTGLEEMFDRVFSRWPVMMESGWMNGYGLDIEETEDAVLVRADAPGFEPEDFNIQILGNALKISAECKAEGKGNTPAIERNFQRIFTLPAGVDPEKVEAKYRQGVLELRLPRLESAKARKIEVKAT